MCSSFTETFSTVRRCVGVKERSIDSVCMLLYVERICLYKWWRIFIGDCTKECLNMRSQVLEYEAWALAVANIQLASLQIKVGNLTGLSV